ncbi:glycosyltransferase, partial [Lacticaseibacillus rhamnosus]
RKDVRNVLRALAHLLRLCEGEMPHPVLKLLIVGGETSEPDPLATPEIGELQRLASELGILEHIHFCGKQQQDSLRYYYSAGDVIVTTPWYEPFGITPLEAMACGTPVIAYRAGSVPEERTSRRPWPLSRFSPSTIADFTSASSRARGLCLLIRLSSLPRTSLSGSSAPTGT